MVDDNDVKAITAIAGAAAGSFGVGAGSVTVATITSSAPGILGVIGFTTTTTVALPVAGIVTAGGLFAFGAYKTYQAVTGNK